MFISSFISFIHSAASLTRIATLQAAISPTLKPFISSFIHSLQSAASLTAHEQLRKCSRFAFTLTQQLIFLPARAFKKLIAIYPHSFQSLKIISSAMLYLSLRHAPAATLCMLNYKSDPRKNVVRQAHSSAKIRCF